MKTLDLLVADLDDVITTARHLNFQEKRELLHEALRNLREHNGYSGRLASLLQIVVAEFKDGHLSDEDARGVVLAFSDLCNQRDAAASCLRVLALIATKVSPSSGIRNAIRKRFATLEVASLDHDAARFVAQALSAQGVLHAKTKRRTSKEGESQRSRAAEALHRAEVKERRRQATAMIEAAQQAAVKANAVPRARRKGLRAS
jgi:hypothetical protein